MARTREEHREYMRAYRARKRAEKVGQDVPPAPQLAAVPPSEPAAAEPKAAVDLDSRRSLPRTVEAAVRDELDAMPTATAARPGLAAAALALAKLLDDPASTPQHPQAAARLSDLLGQVRAVTKPKVTGGARGPMRGAGGIARPASGGEVPGPRVSKLDRLRSLQQSGEESAASPQRVRNTTV